MKQISSLFSRLFFLGALMLVLCAVSEKTANFFGLTMTMDYPPSRLLALSALSLLFAIAVQLREIKIAIQKSLEPNVSDQMTSTLDPAVALKRVA